VPIRAVITKDGRKFVRLVTDAKTKAFMEKEVTTGFEGDGGLVQVTSGLEAGQEIITFSEE
jgi:multidrug efflux pump subunit AcrA (membrane-fusion protein)